jgi:hypothetical protein
MTNRNETIKSIKESLKRLFTSENNFSDFVLTDGTKITSTANQLEIGVEIYAVDEQGNQTPLDNGDYVLNDGRTITITDNKITNIAGEASTEEESPVSDADVSNANVKMEEGLPEEPTEEGDLAQRVADLESQVTEVLNLLKQITESQTQTQEQMMSKIKSIANEPGEESIKTSKKGYEEYNSKTINAKRNMSEIQELRNIIAEKNKRDNNMSL